MTGSAAEPMPQHQHHEPVHDDRPLPVTEAEWNQHYTAAPIWSGNPNEALVAQVTGITPGRALDVGCGEGADAVWLAKNGWRVTAIDVAESALDRARAAAEAAAVDVDWQRAGLLSADLPPAEFDLVSACYPALARTPEQLAEKALLGLVAPGGRLVLLAHADIDRDEALAHGFDPDDYVFADELLAAAGDGWTVERHDRSPRSLLSGAGAGHSTDIVLVLRREEGR